jgi:hypothetical protein
MSVPVASGLVSSGLVSSGLVSSGLVSSGLVSSGLVSSGLVSMASQCTDHHDFRGPAEYQSGSRLDASASCSTFDPGFREKLI